MDVAEQKRLRPGTELYDVLTTSGNYYAREQGLWGRIVMDEITSEMAMVPVIHVYYRGRNVLVKVINFKHVESVTLLPLEES